MNRDICIYTDGACKGNPGKGGYAAIILYVDNNSKEEKIVKQIVGNTKETTNNIMELTAVIKALEYVIEVFRKEKNYVFLNNLKANNSKMKIEIYADSSYVLKGITEWIEGWIKKDFKNVKNVDLWKRLYTLKNDIEKLPAINLVFNKVKGHNGDKYNEMVDKLASNAAMEVI